MKREVWLTRDRDLAFGSPGRGYTIWLTKPKWRKDMAWWHDAEPLLMHLLDDCTKQWLNLPEHLPKGKDGIIKGILDVCFYRIRRAK